MSAPVAARLPPVPVCGAAPPVDEEPVVPEVPVVPEPPVVVEPVEPEPPVDEEPPVPPVEPVEPVEPEALSALPVSMTICAVSLAAFRSKGRSWPVKVTSPVVRPTALSTRRTKGYVSPPFTSTQDWEVPQR